jgi:acyl-CoA thioesterase-2
LGPLLTTSLDHSVWFHAEARADEWLLYAMESTRAAGGRGYSRGSIFRRDGVHVASVTQESMMRPINPGAGAGTGS